MSLPLIILYLYICLLTLYICIQLAAESEFPVFTGDLLSLPANKAFSTLTGLKVVAKQQSCFSQNKT